MLDRELCHPMRITVLSLLLSGKYDEAYIDYAIQISRGV